jgi:hypothetical protein
VEASAPADHGDDFITVYVQVPDVDESLGNVLELGGRVDMPRPKRGGSSSRSSVIRRVTESDACAPSRSRQPLGHASPSITIDI